jgi:hypothetical protein
MAKQSGDVAKRIKASLEKIGTPVIAVCIFLVVSGIYILSPITTVTDSLWTLYTSASLIKEGNLNLDEYEHLIDIQDDTRVITANGHLYSYYPIATPVLAAPIIWLGDKYFSWRNDTDFLTYLSKHKPNETTAKFEELIASLISALGAIFIFLMARQSLDVIRSLLITFIFAFSTSMWSTASRALWQHGTAVLFVSIAIYLVILVEKNKRAIPFLGATLAFAYISRSTTSLVVIFISLYMLINSWKYLIRYTLGFIAVMLPYVAYNWTTYGNILPPNSYQLFQKLTTLPRFLEAMAGTLISPSRGLFIFSSIFLFSIYGMVIRAKHGQLSWRRIDPYLIGIIIGHWLIVSSFYDWDGSWSLGPRYFTDITPCLVYFLIPVAEKGISILRPALKYAFVAALLISTLIHFRCSTSIYPSLWNSWPITHPDGATYRDWDWTDIQFLRGLCKEDPIKGQAPACWFQH